MKEQIFNQETKEKKYDVDFLSAVFIFLNQSNYQTYCRPVAKYLKSVDAAIVLSELIQRHQYHQMRGELISLPEKGDSWFYHTQEAMEERLILGRRTQDRVIDILIKEKFIEITRAGLPCKRYFRINFDGFHEFLKNFYRMYETNKQEFPGNESSQKILLECANRTDKGVQLEQTSPYIYKIPREEKEKQAKENAAPSASLDFSSSFKDDKGIFHNPLSSSISVGLKESKNNLTEGILSDLPDKGNPKKVKTKKQFDESSPAFKLSKLLFETRREISSEVLKPDLQKWAKEMDLILRIDGRSETRLQEVIGYLKIQRSESDGTFLWAAVIKSPQSLRNHFETIAIQMDARKPKVAREEEVHKKFDQTEKNRQWAKEVESKILNKISPHCSFKISDNCVMFTNHRTNTSRPIGFSENGFREQVESQVYKWSG